MPNLFIKANAEIEVDLPEAGWMADWESSEAEEVCEEYGHPKCTINIRIEDPADSVSPVIVHIADRDAIDGSITVKRVDSKKYVFSINGTFKSSIHKNGVSLIDAGAVPSLEGVTRFREGFDFEEPRKVEWTFSTKKF